MGQFRITQGIMVTGSALNQINSQQGFEGRTREYEPFYISPALQNVASVITDNGGSEVPAFHRAVACNFNQKLIGH